MSSPLQQPDSQPSSLICRLTAIDLRALAAFRIGLGVILLCDLFVSAANAAAFYSDAGTLPRDLLVQLRESPWIWSLHTLNGSTAWQMAWIFLHMAAAAALLAGWRTQIAAIVSWVLLCSLQARNPEILHGGDTVLRVLSFWGMFLPLGARWSVDAAQGRRSCFEAGGAVTTSASMALLLQVAMVYWFTAMLKWGSEWTRDGTAIYYALSVDQFVKTPGLLLLHYPQICHALTFSILWLEILGPFAAFIPWGMRWIRLAVVAAFWLLHLGLALCLRLGPFPWIMMVAWIPFLPPLVWDLVEQRLRFLRATASRTNKLPSSRHEWMRNPAIQLFVLACLLGAFLWNLRSTDFERWVRIFPKAVNPVIYLLRIEQYWALFAPRPLADDGWLILDAELADGTHADLLRAGQPVTLAKPARISAEYPDYKWQKLMMNLWLESHQRARPAFASWFTTHWNATHPAERRVTSWTLIYMEELTLPHHHALQPRKVEIARSGESIQGP